MQDKVTRKSSPPIKVYCLPDERAAVQAKAEAAGLSLSAYLLRVGMGYEIQGILDHRRVHDLALVNGDLGRLGGLLKLWLTNDARVAEFTPSTIRALLAKIEATQDELRAVMTQVVRG
ncbi:conjugal transfer transcriptional regulator TraJ [Burkholderia ambifaria]|uniref:conjugal transfer transcriptional regulator TraJ n=1 Tax=Burkholderia ambifaria TaxID=152480 RepID=UPI00158E440C|nr:conjugal transfer transcriptional regulator TraJ [Burkholderia ambifaria]